MDAIDTMDVNQQEVKKELEKVYRASLKVEEEELEELETKEMILVE